MWGLCLKSRQIDYNNQLLVQIQQLEEQQLAYQRSAQEKQMALRQALQVADAARAESNDLRRRLSTAEVRRLEGGQGCLLRVLCL